MNPVQLELPFYEFTQNWFGANIEVWKQIKDRIPDRKAFLEIGSYEGRSTVWTVENLMEDGGEITAVDTWMGGFEHAKDNMNEVEARFDRNIDIVHKLYPRRHVDKWRDTSLNVLQFLRGKKFDFIYIDGSHVAKDVLTDACLAWTLLRKDGVLVFDDYMWGDPEDVLNRPKLAIDTFTTLFAKEVRFVHSGYQLIVQKKV